MISSTQRFREMEQLSGGEKTVVAFVLWFVIHISGLLVQIIMDGTFEQYDPAM